MWASRRLRYSLYNSNRAVGSRLDILKKQLVMEGPQLQSETPETSESLPGDGRLPSWLKAPIPTGKKFAELKETLRELKLHTVWVCRTILLEM